MLSVTEITRFTQEINRINTVTRTQAFNHIKVNTKRTVSSSQAPVGTHSEKQASLSAENIPVGARESFPSTRAAQPQHNAPREFVNLSCTSRCRQTSVRTLFLLPDRETN